MQMSYFLLVITSFIYSARSVHAWLFMLGGGALFWDVPKNILIDACLTVYTGASIGGDQLLRSYLGKCLLSGHHSGRNLIGITTGRGIIQISTFFLSFFLPFFTSFSVFFPFLTFFLFLIFLLFFISFFLSFFLSFFQLVCLTFHLPQSYLSPLRSMSPCPRGDDPKYSKLGLVDFPPYCTSPGHFSRSGQNLMSDAFKDGKFRWNSTISRNYPNMCDEHKLVPYSPSYGVW